MYWYLLAITSVITISVAIILERSLMKKENSSPIGYAIIFQFLLGFFSLMFAIILGRLAFPPIFKMPILFILAAFLWTGSTLFSFYAIKIIGAGELIIITSSSSIISIILGLIVLGEKLSILNFVGIFLVLISVFIVTTSKLTFSSKRGIIFAFISAICSGIAVIIDATILKSYDAFSYTAIMSFLPCIILIIFFLKELNKIKSNLNLKFILKMTIFCFIYTISAICYYLAFQNGAPISILAPISRSAVVLTIILAAIFLKERADLARKFIASLIMLLGLVLLG